jgi:hypothetical protein
MNMRLVRLYGALIIGGPIAMAIPSNLSLAESKDPGLSTSKSVIANPRPKKHRYWRHRGGKHPHFGSRRIRADAARSGK